MPMDRFLIAPLETGMQLNLPPWMVLDDSFQSLNNMYVYLGRIKKRFGSQFLGRLRINLGNTDGAGNIAGTVPGIVFKIGQEFTIGTEIFTVYQTGAPGIMLDTGAATVKTYNTTTGAYVIHGAAAATPLFFYPSEPVMAFANLDSGQFNDYPSFAFDTQFAYQFIGGAWVRSETGGVPTWRGSNLNFVWTYNWTGLSDSNVVLFATNFQVTNPNGVSVATDDPLYAYVSSIPAWVEFTPYFAPNGNAPLTGPYVLTARIIIAFQNRLLLLNTIENDNSGGLGVNSWYPSRCRYSWYGSPFSQNAWYQRGQNDNGGTDPNVNLAGGASFIDATTDEQIISAEFIKNRLIVFFQYSTWEIVYTGNEITPFKWQKINTELGSQSMKSSVPFDKAVFTFGETGIHACNGSNVERIDTKIPINAFDVQQQNLQPTRIAGIRDYFNEMVYWSAPTTAQESNQVYPGYIYVYNYRINAFSFYTDCITAFGYFYQQTNLTWQLATNTWQQYNQAWQDEDQAQFEDIIGGNQQGFTFLIRDDFESNAFAMQITNITVNGSGQTILTIIDNTLLPLDFLQISGAQGVTGLNGNIYGASPVPGSTTQVLIQAWDPVNLVWIPAAFTGVYTGGGTVARVSQPFILTKMWNPYVKNGRNVFIQCIDFGVLRTSEGSLTVNYRASSGNLQMLGEAQQSGAVLGTGILETSPYPTIPFEAQQTILWHPIYFQSDGEFIQLQMYLNNTQMTTPAIVREPIEIQGMVLHTQPTASRLE